MCDHTTPKNIHEPTPPTDSQRKIEIANFALIGLQLALLRLKSHYGPHDRAPSVPKFLEDLDSALEQIIYERSRY